MCNTKTIPQITLDQIKYQASGIFFSLLLLVPAWMEAADNKPQDLSAYKSEPIQPVPVDLPHDKNKIRLGEMLFTDPRLSVDGEYRCTTCHDLRNGGVDHRKNPAVRYGKVNRNVPTLFNSRFNLAQVWDGRFRSIEEDADATITDPMSFNSTWHLVAQRLQESSNYTSLFKMIYPDGITKNNVLDAIASFVRSMVTINAPFDRYLRGESNAISHRAKLGYQHFKEYGCPACHNGISVGGNMFQRIGITRDYFKDKIGIIEPDLGRMQVTGDINDRYEFKVPSLRLVTRTAPYMHDGSVETLEEAIKVMGRYQLGRDIPQEHIRLIIDFLHTLRGEYRGYRP